MTIVIFGSFIPSSIHTMSPGNLLSTSGPVWAAGHIGRTLPEALPGVGEAVNETSREDARRR